MSTARIQAVLVLYGMELAASPTYRTWLESTKLCPSFHAVAELMVCDNTPGAERRPTANFQGTFLHQPHNPGLAPNYNLALRHAEAESIPWLLLLDQDTELTAAYLNEVEAMVRADGGEYSALVPKLFGSIRLLSPHIPMYAPPEPALSPGISGRPDRRLSFFNSAAVLRVSALRAIGGFPEAFPLDYLDHAVFHQLQQRNEPICILENSLQHGLSTLEQDAEDNPTWVRRQNEGLAAQLRFYARYGERGELLRHRKHLTVEAFRAALQGRVRQAARLLKTAVLPAGSR